MGLTLQSGVKLTHGACQADWWPYEGDLKGLQRPDALHGTGGALRGGLAMAFERLGPGCAAKVMVRAAEHSPDLLREALTFRTPCLLTCCCIPARSMTHEEAGQDHVAAGSGQRHPASSSHLAT